jgi:glycosyltransferase involved in cell wall biosynthesis
VKEFGLGNDLFFAGNRKDTENIYAASDIIGLTSFNEGTPLSLIEAMASGRAVISTAVGGVIDLLGKSVETRGSLDICENGLSVASGNAEGFADGLIYLGKNEELREKLGNNSKKFVTKRYSKERLVNDLKNLYRLL